MKNISEARKLTLKYLEPIVKKHGFLVKSNSSKQATIDRQHKNGIDTLAYDFINYSPVFQIRYAFQKINFSITDILLKLQETKKLSLQEEKDSYFLFFSYNTINRPTHNEYLPMMETEEDVQNAVKLMENFIDDVGIPLLEKYNDLAFIDATINGIDPWESDWHKPFILGSNFHLKRLVIAKLAEQESYPRIFEYVSEWYTTRFNDKYGPLYKVAMSEVEALHKFLMTM